MLGIPRMKQSHSQKSHSLKKLLLCFTCLIFCYTPFLFFIMKNIIGKCNHFWMNDIFFG